MAWSLSQKDILFTEGAFGLITQVMCIVSNIVSAQCTVAWAWNSIRAATEPERPTCMSFVSFIVAEVDSMHAVGYAAFSEAFKLTTTTSALEDVDQCCSPTHT
eukprot:4642910-Amphidinium_carterae.1